MKKIIFLGLLVGLYACEGKDPTPKYTQQPHQHWIPNWEKDTMVAISGNPGSYLTDVMYSETIGDSSVLYYNGEKYYIWTENVKTGPAGTNYYFRPNMMEYNMIVISKIPFTNLLNDFFSDGAYVKPASYVDPADSTWKTQFQSMKISRMPNISGWSAPAIYSTENKQYLQ